MSAELGARAISHLEEASDDGIVAMATAQVVAVLLPTTAYVLRLKCPPARKMINKGLTHVQCNFVMDYIQVYQLHLEVILIQMLSACQW